MPWLTGGCRFAEDEYIRGATIPWYYDTMVASSNDVGAGARAGAGRGGGRCTRDDSNARHGCSVTVNLSHSNKTKEQRDVTTGFHLIPSGMGSRVNL